MTTRDQETIDLIEREWDAFERRLDAASPDAFDRAVFTGEGEGWRLRDLLAHIVFWQDLAARALERMTADGVKPRADQRLRDFMGEPRRTEELNRSAVASRRERPVREVRRELRLAHTRLVAAIGGCPPELLFDGEGPEAIVPALHMPAIQHLRLHTPHVEAALKEGATTA